MEKIKIELSTNLKPKPQDESKLAFGKIFTDHMFLMDYSDKKGWFDPRIVPYAPISINPAASGLHYGQLIFEGLKAYRSKTGEIVMFRPEKNMKRLNASNERLCMPTVDVDFMVGALKELIRIEKDWVPAAQGTSLYIRPFIIATEPFLGVKPSGDYMFIVILSPVGSYYPNGIQPVGIYVENEYVRAIRGGVGHAKCAGNYAASMKSQIKAAEKGFAQVLWLDGVERKYIEEVGAMNIFFAFEDEIVTPELSGSILPGITRASILDLLKSWGMPVSERRISIDEIIEAYDGGKLKEVFGTGTAAVISPVGELTHGDKKMVINNGEIGKLSKKLYDEITGIQKLEREDKFGWITRV
ncbi:MAG: branched-chain amino acid aminotransferase [Oscillospiraceae bacterium]|nr:branched-chain amino acid aminotransferase [Oscillospiraceae bacterium]